MMSAIVPMDLPFDCVISAASARANESAKKLADKIFKSLETKSISIPAHCFETFLESYLRSSTVDYLHRN